MNIENDTDKNYNKNKDHSFDGFMVSKNARHYSQEELVKAFEDFNKRHKDFKEAVIQHSVSDQDILSEYNDELTNAIYLELTKHELLKIPDPCFKYTWTNYLSSNEKMEIGWKAYIDEINQKAHTDIRNKTELGRSIYGDKDILLKIGHVSLVPKED